jgi:cysteine desulfurase family protein
VIYLDNAATTLYKPPQVAQAVMAALVSFGNSGRGTHTESLTAARTIYDTREKLAALFGCPRADHICFTANSTEALNIAIAGLFSPNDHIISTDLEHNSVLRPLYRLREQGAAVDFVPADTQGCIDYDAFARLLRPSTRGIVCTHASNLTGNALDIGRIGAFAHARGLVLIVDASQTAGTLPIDMTRQNIDVLCFTGHKSLLGPQGTGGLAVREGVEIRPWKVGGTGVQSFSETQPEAYPTRLEAGTLNGHGIAGLHAALDFLQATGVAAIHAHEIALMRRFYDAVRSLPNVTVYGDFSTDLRAPVVSLNIGAMDSAEVSDALSERWQIATRPGAHCAPRLHRALGTAEQGAVRFSWSWYNTAEETDAAIDAVRQLAKEV